MESTNERDLAARRYQSAARDLERIVRRIAERYIVQQVPLTWRLLHAIEAEALADLGLAGRHDAPMLGLFQRPDSFAWPETDETVDFGKSNALPAVFAFAVAAYEDAALAVDARNAANVAGNRSRSREGGTRRVRAWGG